MNLLSALLIIAIIVIVLFWAADSNTTLKTETGAVNLSNANNNNLLNISNPIPTIIQDIQNTAADFNLNPAILFGIASAEQGTTNISNWNTQAFNPNDPSGSYGLTQIEGQTAESFGVNPSDLLGNAALALNTTAQYINQYSTDPNNMTTTAGIYNGGPSIWYDIQNGSASSETQSAINNYVGKAVNGYNYYNLNYGGS